jgi:nucleotide-binding universal stress UspA family protein
MRHILAAIDFSSVTEHVLRITRTQAKAGSTKIWLVHVAAPDPDFVGFEVGPSYIRDRRAAELREEHVRLQAYADALKQDGHEAEALLVQGPTTETLLDVARRVGAEMIIMGSHGRGALYRAFIGSVSEQVLRDARLPVLIVPDPARP